MSDIDGPYLHIDVAYGGGFNYDDLLRDLPPDLDVVRVSGRYILGRRLSLPRHVFPWLRDNDVVVNLDVNEIDSGGASDIVSFIGHRRRRGLGTYLVGAGEAIGNMWRICKLDLSFRLFTSIEEAMASRSIKPV